MCVMKDVKETKKRNRFALNREDLLNDYVRISKSRPGAALATALRDNSPRFLDIFAFQATSGNSDWITLKKQINAGNYSSLDKAVPAQMLEIATYLMLRPESASDRDLAKKIFLTILNRIPPKNGNFKARKLLVEHLIIEGDRSEALELLDRWPDLDAFGDYYLRAETDNPNIFHDAVGGYWLANLNRQFAEDGFWPIAVPKGVLNAFDRVTCIVPESHIVPKVGNEPPLVSVIIPTYEPDETELRTAVESICRQTLRDIEIIIVDDASGIEYAEVIRRVAGVDPRIRVITAKSNSGVYVARNIGYAEAKGEFITGQDDDDWSHPERLAFQVRYLRAHAETVACRVAALTCLPNMSRVRYGYKFRSPNASSLMIRKEAFRKTGGFLETRKASDTELHYRLEKITGKRVDDLNIPLTLVRITPTSLSRSEFLSGWSHPARRSFKSSYNYWHSHSSKNDLVLRGKIDPLISVPRRFAIATKERTKEYDVVFAGTWNKWGGPQKSMLEEICALKSIGLKLAVLHLDAARFMNTTERSLCDPIQKLINNGTVDELFFDDEVIIDLLILRYPPILQFMAAEPTRLAIQSMVILANQAPSEMDGTDVRYLVDECHETAKACFTNNVKWAPQGPQVRQAIKPYLEEHSLLPFDIPGIVDIQQWKSNTSNIPRSFLPVIGRYSRDDEMKWPESAEIIEAVYPTTGVVDVRLMGGAKAARTVLGRESVPAAWTSFAYGSMTPQQFLSTIDFFVFFQNTKATEAFGRSILEALAFGLVVILPKQFEATFGDAAIYCSASSVLNVVRELHQDRDRYATQSLLARKIVRERFSHESYSSLIKGLLDKIREF